MMSDTTGGMSSLLMTGVDRRRDDVPIEPFCDGRCVSESLTSGGVALFLPFDRKGT